MALVRPRSTMLELAEGPELTIASGAITVTHGLHAVDTESDAATDDLATIDGGYVGQVITLQRAASGRVVVLVEGGNIVLVGDCRALDGSFKCALVLDDDSITLRYDGTTWVELHRAMGFLGCRLARGASQSVPDTAFTNCDWTVKTWEVGDWAPDLGGDPDGVFAPEGVYAVKTTFQVAWVPVSVGLRVQEILYGSLYAGGHRATNTGGSIPAVLVATSTYAPVDPGTQLVFRLWQNSGNALAHAGSGSGGSYVHIEAIR